MKVAARVYIVCCLFSLVIGASVWAQDQSPPRYQVVDQDFAHKGVSIRISRIHHDGNQQVLERTDSTGFLPAVTMCRKGDRIQAIPDSTKYYPSRVVVWPPSSLLVFVRSVQYVANLEVNLETLTMRQDYGTAALVLTELHSRRKEMNEIDKEAARLATEVVRLTEKHSYEMAAFVMTRKLGEPREGSDWAVAYDPPPGEVGDQRAVLQGDSEASADGRS